MKTPRHRISNIISDRSLKSGLSKTLSREIAAYLLRERRVAELDSVMRDVQSNWADAGQVEVIATSAHSISASVSAGIIKQAKAVYPNAKKIIVTEVTDPAVLGGVRLSIADQQLDLSVEAKLNQFKQLTAVGKE